ncbi:MAG: NADH-quinone oxidoreductase subunit NuoN [Alphaproteobacteria bacterium]|jgi:NADH-quinone oxidoreductase subunit N|nr:NADH-quinone oxidoreductase subunit NuoN [Alphaproteobacteria bacterium]
MNLAFETLDLSLIFPELVLLGSAFILLIIGLFRGEYAFHRVMLISKIALAAVFIIVCATHPAREVAFQGAFVSDAFSILMKALVLGSALIVLMVSRKSLASEDIAQYEYPILVLLAVLGMMVMISANDLISLFIGLELQSLSLYVLTALRRDNVKSSEAGMKYFVLGALSTGLLLYGCSLIYGYTGTTNFDVIADMLKGMKSFPLPMMFGLVFLMAGLIFKISAVPFHMWTPDVYEGSPTSITTFLASAPKVAGFALITRVFISPFISILPQWQMMLAVIAIASMVLGAFAALNQRNIKRLLAYSAIGNMGYALIGIVVGTEESVTASILYIFLYLIMIVGVFACLLNITRRSQETDTIEDLKGLVRFYPGTAFILSFLLFSMAGIPPLAGFLGKLYIFKAAVAANFYILAIIGVLTSVVAAAYYLWIVKAIMMDDPDLDRWAEHYRSYRREPAMTFVLLGTVAGLIWVFIVPSPIIKLANDAAASLFDF